MVKTICIRHAIILSGGEAMDPILIGKFLAALRKERGMTQEELGEKIGVTNKTISRWENGNYMPPVEALLALSELYKISINEILTGRRLSIEDYKKSAEKHIQVSLKKYHFLRNLLLGIIVVATFILTVFTNMQWLIFGGTPEPVLSYIATLLHIVSLVIFLLLYKSVNNRIMIVSSLYWGIFALVNLIIVFMYLLAPQIEMTWLIVLFLFLFAPFAPFDLDAPYNFLVIFIIAIVFFTWSLSRVILNRKRK